MELTKKLCEIGEKGVTQRSRRLVFILWGSNYHIYQLIFGGNGKRARLQNIIIHLNWLDWFRIAFRPLLCRLKRFRAHVNMNCCTKKIILTFIQFSSEKLGFKLPSITFDDRHLSITFDRRIGFSLRTYTISFSCFTNPTNSCLSLLFIDSEKTEWTTSFANWFRKLSNNVKTEKTKLRNDNNLIGNWRCKHRITEKYEKFYF